MKNSKMTIKSDTVQTNGIKITPELTEALENFLAYPIEEQKTILARSGFLISGINDPGIIPIDKEFFLILDRTYELLSCIQSE